MSLISGLFLESLQDSSHFSSPNPVVSLRSTAGDMLQSLSDKGTEPLDLSFARPAPTN